MSYNESVRVAYTAKQALVMRAGEQYIEAH